MPFEVQVRRPDTQTRALSSPRHCPRNARSAREGKSHKSHKSMVLDPSVGNQRIKAVGRVRLGGGVVVEVQLPNISAADLGPAVLGHVIHCIIKTSCQRHSAGAMAYSVNPPT